MSLAITSRIVSGVVIVDLSGRLCFLQFALRDQINELLEQGHRDFVYKCRVRCWILIKGMRGVRKEPTPNEVFRRVSRGSNTHLEQLQPPDYLFRKNCQPHFEFLIPGERTPRSRTGRVEGKGQRTTLGGDCRHRLSGVLPRSYLTVIVVRTATASP